MSYGLYRQLDIRQETEIDMVRPKRNIECGGLLVHWGYDNTDPVLAQLSHMDW